MAEPLSVIIPTYNRARYIAEAVTSVLEQGELDAELVVVDDGSTDDTRQVLESFGSRVRYVSQVNSGPAAARNTGVNLATGEMIGFLDSDDLVVPGSLDRRIEILSSDPSVDLVLGLTQVVVMQPGDHQGSESWLPCDEPAELRSLGATVVRRTVLERVGPFDEQLPFGEDDDWFMRAEELAARIVVDPFVCQRVRRHDSNMTSDRAGRTEALLRLLKNRRDRGSGDSGHNLTRSEATLEHLQAAPARSQPPETSPPLRP